MRAHRIKSKLTNGIQALLKANRGKPDILIIDVNMSEADGLAVSRTCWIL
ncbi:MAG: hypothetical protein QOD09_2763 [Bradyrhizobium sp.]|jgi:CheY-like chemotaxis protein|nr:hypothetical protein [Bradyrhizobium sp.]